MGFVLVLIRNTVCKSFFKQYCSATRSYPVVKVVSLSEDGSVKLSFKIGNFSHLLKAPKLESVEFLLSRIKHRVALQRTREEIYNATVNKTNAAQVAVKTVEEDVDVSLIANDKIIDERTPNLEAWPQASALKIGDVMYEIHFNTPTILNLTLPNYILANCILRPRFLFECLSLDECTFSWYRSMQMDNISNSDLNSMDWVNVGNKVHYLTSSQDVGCYLKLVCTPKQVDKIGQEFSVISKKTVEAEPSIFPIKNRCVFTPLITDKNKFRCVSYNTLANMYVEKRKFPYASEKARDVYYRKQLLLREILGYNSDIICLQEVQERMFEYDFLPILKEEGFEGFYRKKGGHRHEGIATFIRSSKFRIVFDESVLLNEVVKEKNIFIDLLNKVGGNFKDMSRMLAQDTALQINLVESINDSKNKVVVANTHLYSNKDMPEVRLLQAALCIYYLEHFIKEKCPTSAGVIFCGDFNSLPLTEAYDFITTGTFKCCPSWKNSNINSYLNEDTTLRHNLNLESACGTPMYTNYTEEFQGCLDYIFYDKDFLEVTDVAPMPNHSDVTLQVGLPSDYFPSDHLAIICTLKWKNKNL